MDYKALCDLTLWVLICYHPSLYCFDLMSLKLLFQLPTILFPKISPHHSSLVYSGCYSSVKPSQLTSSLRIAFLLQFLSQLPTPLFCPLELIPCIFVYFLSPPSRRNVPWGRDLFTTLTPVENNVYCWAGTC